MNKENCALKLVDEIILYYDARSKKHQRKLCSLLLCCTDVLCNHVIVLILESCFIYHSNICAEIKCVGNSINDPELYNHLKTCMIELY